MPKKLEVFLNKTLKLSNVLIREVDESELGDIEKIAALMEAYMKSKGSNAIGPLIQYTNVSVRRDGVADIRVSMLMQANKYINHIESPYKIQSVHRIKNCLYLRFVGTEYNLKYAYDKLKLFAYEEDVQLVGDNYTIFMDSDNDTITADIFMEYIAH